MSRKALDICGTGNPRGQVGAQWMVWPMCGVADIRQVQFPAPDGQQLLVDAKARTLDIQVTT